MNAKFKTGDNVSLSRPTLYDELEGVIMDVEKVYQQCYSDGTLDPDGLNIRESDIKDICLPYTIDGDTLSITYSTGRTRIYKFFGSYAYTISTPKMTSIYPEKALKLKQ